MPWAFKFAWAPLLDRYGNRRWGHRRSWILPLQLMGIILLLSVACFNPKTLFGPGLPYLMAALFLTNLVSATQDIATDALAVENLDYNERGLGNGVQVSGYRVGMIVGGGALLVVLDSFGWHMAFVMIALMLLLASLPVWFFREPKRDDNKILEGEKVGTDVYWEFIRQPHIRPWLVIVIIYKAGDALGSGMVKPMLVDMGLGLADIGWLIGTTGSLAGIAGALFGGYLMPRLGRFRALVSFALVQAVAVGSYAFIAQGCSGILIIYGLSIFEHFTGGMATAALFTVMMDVCRKGLAGTDYTIQASLQVIVCGGLHAMSGYSASWLGYTSHFLLAGGIGLVIVIPVWWYFRYSEVSTRDFRQKL